MKKLLVIIFVIGLFAFVTYAAEAAQTDSLTLKVRVTPSISVSITETELVLGDVAAGGIKVSTAGVTVTNDGSGANETYSLSLTNPASPTPLGWTAVQDTPDVEKYILNAAFDADGTNVDWDNAKHALSTAPTPCSATKFAGDQNGLAVPYNSPRLLWFQFQAPTATNITLEQGIVVTVTAQAS